MWPWSWTRARGAFSSRLPRSSPRLDAPGNGAGDIIAALFLLHYLRSGNVAEALAWATSSVFGLLKRSGDAHEIALITAQEELVAPSEMFVPQRIGL